MNDPGIRTRYRWNKAFQEKGQLKSREHDKEENADEGVP